MNVSVSAKSVQFALITITLSAAYFAAAKFGLSLAIVHASSTAVWPPTGISIAAFLLFGYRSAPGIFLGAFFANITTEGTWATSLGIATGNTLEGVVACFLVNRYASGKSFALSSFPFFKFVAAAALLATMVSATIGVSSLSVAGFAPWEKFWEIWLTWWLGDATGALIVAPPLVLWTSSSDNPRNKRYFAEVFFVFLSAALLGIVLFGGPFSEQIGNSPIGYVCIPIVVWTAFRLGSPEAATVVLLLSMGSVWGTVRGFGPFTGYSPNESLLYLQTFMATLSIIAIPLAAEVHERKRKEAELKKAHGDLEIRIRERTESLTEMNRNLLQVSQELRRSNQQLEEFAYAASHDLKTPLRNIASFAQVFSEEFKGKLDPSGEQYLEIIQDGAVRMHRLIDDLLEYAKLGSQKVPFTRVDCNEVLAEALLSMQKEIERANARVVREPLPPVNGDREQLIRVFQNLIGNAIKFRGKPVPVVEVSCKDSDGEFIFKVTDNGIGIDSQYREKVFEIFQRLHTPDEYPGTGVGLSICRKIIENHGGRIWVESSAGNGTTVGFSIPKPTSGMK